MERNKMIPVNRHNNKHLDTDESCAGCLFDGWQEGFGALKEWLFSPCTEHLLTVTFIGYPTERKEYPPQRIKCPECMKELNNEVF
jgi:hypothetical protein